MGVIVLQPFENPYSLRELEVDFGVDIDKYSEKEQWKYLLENKGRLARDVKKMIKERRDNNEI